MKGHSLSIFAAALVCLAAGSVPAAPRRAVEVIDGRSFSTSDGLRVRLLGVNVPRLYEPGGDVCRDALAKYVGGQEVRLDADGAETDAEGWLLRYVFVGDTLVNAMMARKGFADIELPDSGYRHGDSLHALERTAARIGKGLWPFGVFPPPSFTGTEPGLADTTGSDPWLETVAYDKADRYYGRIVRVIGTVVATYRSDKVFIMNFHQDYRRYFKAVVFPGDLAKFPPNPEDYYKKRVVRVTGLVKEYGNAPEMILNDPGQLEVLE